MADIPTLTLPDGKRVPVLGIGTWEMADHRRQRSNEIAAIQTAVDLGMTVIDTAEMYGNGAAESLVGEAIGNRRSQVFLVSKVLPQHAIRRGTISACEASLRRLKTDRLDMYLLHWRGRVPLEETLVAFNTLRRDGKIRYWGVSNFDVKDMEELMSLTAHAGSPCATNQVLYNLERRGIEYDLLPWCRDRNVPLMAYSPLERGELVKHKGVRAIADRVDATAAQIALAWVLRQPGVIAIPKSSDPARVRENRATFDVPIAPTDLREFDRMFPPPARKTPLDMI
jgi:diketogulonate reductase-like aldo/keto reductase